MPKGRLTGAACYLAGPMTACADFGAEWREEIEAALRPMGVVVLNPVNKAIEIGQEDAEARKKLDEARQTGNLQAVKDFMKPIRRVDLRSCDLSSFIIVRVDGTDTYGTHEEVSTSVLQQKPVLALIEGDVDRTNLNPWLVSQLPLDHIFFSRESLLCYLWGIHNLEYHPTDRRWMLFDFAELYSEALRAADEC